MFVEPIHRFVSDYVAKGEPVPRLLLLNQAKMCLPMFEISAFAIQRFSAGERWTRHLDAKDRWTGE